MLSFLYLGLRHLFAFLILLGRSADRKELEILVLRHELSVLRRQEKAPRYRVSDRALLAALSRALPRERWSAFAVTPETLLRWHRSIVKRRWTYARRAPGRRAQEARAFGVGDLGTQPPAAPRCAASATARSPLVARIPAPASGEPDRL